jgi:hypothetical protein
MRFHMLTVLLVAYAAASLLHHIHNAVFLGDYPNMPVWISPAGVYAAWLLEACIGAGGYLLIRRGRTIAGLLLIAAYGAFGFDGFGHYSLAPMSAHTLMMNLTIWLEALTAALLLIVVARSMVQVGISRK